MINGATDELVTIRDWLRWAVSRFNESELFFGHGTDNAWDEAVWLVLATLHLPRDTLEPWLDARLTKSERMALLGNLQQRVVHRLPTAYLVQEAWLGEFRFYVDQRVIVPRSYFAELLEHGFAPWIEDPEAVESALDLCTGSGCLAILAAHAFPEARIDAVDLSPEALAVARRNVDDYELGTRLRLVQSNAFAGIQGRQYDVIISNPPYVNAESMAVLPEEFRREPEIALAGGKDGLDLVRIILREAPSHLKTEGILVVEIGHNRDDLEMAFPDTSFIWLDTCAGDRHVFLLRREDLV